MSSQRKLKVTSDTLMTSLRIHYEAFLAQKAIEMVLFVWGNRKINTVQRRIIIGVKYKRRDFIKNFAE